MYNFLTYRGEAEGKDGVREVSFHTPENRMYSFPSIPELFSTGSAVRKSRLAEILQANIRLSPYQQG